MDKCEVCSAPVRELRRGRCWGCYSRWVEARPVGYGACCQVCGERRRGHLRSIELLGSWTPVCHSCAARVAQLDPAPRSVAAVRDALRRERRQRDRRAGLADRRAVPIERRRGERRAGVDVAPGAHGTAASPSAVPPHGAACPLESATLVDDDMVIEISELASELESLAQELGEVADLTRIHDFNR
jgi:hypothetical protein